MVELANNAAGFELGLPRSKAHTFKHSVICLVEASTHLSACPVITTILFSALEVSRLCDLMISKSLGNQNITGLDFCSQAQLIATFILLVETLKPTQNKVFKSDIHSLEESGKALRFY